MIKQKLFWGALVNTVASWRLLYFESLHIVAPIANKKIFRNTADSNPHLIVYKPEKADENTSHLACDPRNMKFS